MTINTAFTSFPELTTERLHLRQLKTDDAPALFPIYSDPQIMEFYGNEPHQSLGETQALVERNQARYANREAVRWCITQRDDERAIGTCGFHHFDENFLRAETGYILNRAYWGKGIMKDAMSAILTYAFTEMGLHRVEAIIDIANERSKGLLLKLGFTYEGNLRQRFFFRDRFEDDHYFGLLKHEWNNR